MFFSVRWQFLSYRPVLYVIYSVSPEVWEHYAEFSMLYNHNTTVFYVKSRVTITYKITKKSYYKIIKKYIFKYIFILF